MRVVARKIVLSSIAVMVLAGVGIAYANQKPSTRHLAVTPIAVKATPIRNFSRAGVGTDAVGKLKFLGGLVLTAPGVKNFGGWSGLALDPDGRSFVAISDAGAWMRGRITSKGGAPTGIDDAEIGPLRSLQGKTLTGRNIDAESVAIESGTPRDGTILIAFERNSRIARYRLGRNGLSSTLALLEKPTESRKMKSNAGFEAMTVMRGGPMKGSLVAMAERLLDDDGNHTGWIWQAKAPPRAFHLTNIGGFDITDLASLDDGTLFVLERRFRWLEGVKMRIRRIPAEALGPGAVMSGDILMDASMASEIDNMEGLGAARSANGDVILTVISDDNFNTFLQRNLLLQFALPSAKTAEQHGAH